jgi:hypothetical protein
LPIDYPRINQFPEWFTVEEGKEYSIESSLKELTGKYSGKQLLEGIPVKLLPGNQMIVTIQ